MDIVTFTKKILNGKFHFFYSANEDILQFMGLLPRLKKESEDVQNESFEDVEVSVNTFATLIK